MKKRLRCKVLNTVLFDSFFVSTENVFATLLFHSFILLLFHFLFLTLSISLARHSSLYHRHSLWRSYHLCTHLSL